MRVALGADHKGFPLKEKIKRYLEQRGDEVTDYGTFTTESCDYPDFGLKVAHAVRDGVVKFGINICWTGNGMNMAANKVKGIRSGLCLSEEMAQLTREHNDANILSLASKYTEPELALKIVETFLTSVYQGGRHDQRLAKITAEER
jgi:ribose 5-phosphate isomerase B